jgi:hypothetical protein
MFGFLPKPMRLTMRLTLALCLAAAICPIARAQPASAAGAGPNATPLVRLLRTVEEVEGTLIPAAGTYASNPGDIVSPPSTS